MALIQRSLRNSCRASPDAMRCDTMRCTANTISQGYGLDLCQASRTCFESAKTVPELKTRSMWRPGVRFCATRFALTSTVRVQNSTTMDSRCPRKLFARARLKGTIGTLVTSVLPHPNCSRKLSGKSQSYFARICNRYGIFFVWTTRARRIRSPRLESEISRHRRISFSNSLRTRLLRRSLSLIVSAPVRAGVKSGLVIRTNFEGARCRSVTSLARQIARN